MRILIAGCIALMSGSALAQAADFLTTSTHPEEGTYVADADGMSLYLFLADAQGSPDGAGAASACEDDCLAVWPALVVEDVPTGDETLDPALIGTMERSDGTLQVTYNGWPLYYYAEDMAPGDINGHDIESFGEEWYLVGPDGGRAEGGGGDDDDDDDDDVVGDDGNSGPGGGDDDDDDAGGY